MELAFVLAQAAAGARASRCSTCLQATEYVMPALEIIDARIEQFDRDTKAPRKVFDTIADFAANAGIVLGGRPVKPDAVDLRWVGALLYKNAVIEETGLAAAVLNHPAIGVAWLANKIAPYGEQLDAGDVDSGRLVHAPDDRGARRCAPRRLRAARQYSMRSFDWSERRAIVQMPVNTFKQALRNGTRQIGLWMGLADPMRGRDARGGGIRLAADRRRAFAQRSAQRARAAAGRRRLSRASASCGRCTAERI